MSPALIKGIRGCKVIQVSVLSEPLLTTTTRLSQMSVLSSNKNLQLSVHPLGKKTRMQDITMLPSYYTYIC